MAIWSPNPAEIYLYGGFGYDKDYKGSRVLADFWRYNSTRGEWEEMSKESHSIERVLGEGGRIIYPGYRVKAKHWIDGDGNLWLAFGQSIISSEKISIEPFIWKYDTKKGIWSYTYVANDPIIESAELIWMPLGNRIEMIFPNSLNKDFRFSVKPELLQLNLKN
ncbi:hypothetical protein Lbys_3283 [Leadbetterella byssophila DSM 17132]|uniref:Kelch repeat type 1-containing protein n=1 Tax=Leadbetterella byssophila (strain DSM 17132 / JCM 16389 / KACC 11308 / NBRC 106382 / 4M15) TaxID=649349 RepID=E4RWK2_LEAB4|nr:hypothetical protein [Leadbetterella byssophila]ADQ18942.1 hypothetical protein Lbys_3283 [Leadbetterella byssophila DSM 17132]